MLTKTVDLMEAQRQFTEIVSLVQTGTEVILIPQSGMLQTILKIKGFLS
jgi:hypothetical protein